MPKIEMICLANSRKRQGRCLAGLRTDGQGWIRPVGPGNEGTLFPHQYRLPNGQEPKLLDVVRIGCFAPAGKPHQPENWIIDGTCWELAEAPDEAAREAMIRAAFADGPALLGNQFDRVSYDRFLSLPAEESLTLVSPDRLEWRVALTQYFHRQIRACFTHKGAYYELSVTDPKWEHRFAHLPEGTHNHTALGLANGLPSLVVSLGEPFNGYCYKLVAGVF